MLWTGDCDFIQTQNIKSINNKSETFASMACDFSSDDRLGIVKELIDLGCSLDVRDNKGRTALDLAIERCDLTLMKLLLESGADIDRSSGTFGRYERETPLHIAAERSSLEVVKLLVKYGADIHVRDRFGESPLLKAAKAGKKEVMNFLLTCGADLNDTDLEGWNALMWAAWKGHISTVAWILDQRKENINKKDRFGKTILHLAAERQQELVVKLLLKKGCDPCIRDSVGKTPLEYVTVENISLRELLQQGSNLIEPED